MTFSPNAPEAAREVRAKTRARLIALRRGLPAEERRRLSGRIQSLALADGRWRAARTVALYVAVRGEVSTERLLDAAWSAGKTVLLPRCLPPDPHDPPEAGGRMEFLVCSRREELVPGRYGLLEPGPACQRVACSGAVSDRAPLPDLAVFPAVGLRSDGARLGYGGGYYDRAFSRPGWSAVPRLALIYACQLAWFPVDGDRDACPDLAVHGYATEERLLWL